MILSVGQFIPRKGFDILLEAARSLPEDIGVYIVGGQPGKEYTDFVEKNDLDNVHFVDFMTKAELKYYYLAADLFVFPTREDIWGLVINEAAGYGLPVVTTEKCLAGLELVDDGVNGYIIPVEDAEKLTEAVKKVFNTGAIQMGIQSRKKARDYTIESMAQEHIHYLERT